MHGLQAGCIALSCAGARIGIRHAAWQVSCRLSAVACQGPRIRTVQYGRHAVAKGQMKSNREKKKPKQDKTKAAPANTGFASATSNPAASGYSGKKK
jgi:hypothetical protein